MDLRFKNLVADLRRVPEHIRYWESWKHGSLTERAADAIVLLMNENEQIRADKARCVDDLRNRLDAARKPSG